MEKVLRNIKKSLNNTIYKDISFKKEIQEQILNNLKKSNEKNIKN